MKAYKEFLDICRELKNIEEEIKMQELLLILREKSEKLKEFFKINNPR